MALGPTDLRVSRLGFGCARLGGVFAGPDRRQSVALLRAARDLGINFFDTADMYTQGESERALGEAFRRDRSSVVIATKTGYVLPSQRRLAAAVKPLLRPVVRRLGLRRGQVPASVRGRLAQSFTPAHVRSSAEASLRRLGTDYLDLYQLHSPPLEVIEAGAFVPVLEALVKEGKVRYFGISCEEPEHTPAAVVHPVAAVQLRASILRAEPSRAAIDQAAAAGVGVIARECLAGGALAQSAAADGPAERAGRLDRADAQRLLGLRAEAEARGTTLRELALDWVAGQPGVATVLLGMSDRRQLTENLAAFSR